MPDKRVTEWIKSKCHFPKLSRVNTAWGNISSRLSYSVGVRQHGTFRPGSQLENLTAALPQMVRITGWSFLTEKWNWSRIWLLVTSWTIAYQVPPSTGFSRPDYWSRLPFLSPGDLPNPGIKPRSPALQTRTLSYEPPGKPISHYQFTEHIRGSLGEIHKQHDTVQHSQ